MTQKNWNLITAADPSGQERRTITPSDVGGPAAGYTIQQRRLQGGLSDGVDVVTIDNGLLRFDVLPTRGMNIHKACIGDEPIGWNSPVRGPVHPAFVPLSESSGLGWLTGFDEWIARCGLESNGAPDFNQQGQLLYGLHGRISNRPAHRVDLQVDGETGTITLTGVVDETRFLFSKLRLISTITTKVGEPVLEIRDTVQNLSASPANCQLLYHLNFGPPLLDAGARVTAAISKLAPRDARAAEDLARWDQYVAPQAGFAEQVYFAQLQSDQQQNTRVVLANSDATRGTSLMFNTRQLPCFSLWKNTTAEADGYVTGLEPATNFPNPRSFEAEQGRVVHLEGGQHRSFDLRFEFHQDPDDVKQAVQQVHALEQQQAEICHQPEPLWFTG